MAKILIVVDMQNDFIDGVLGTKEAHAIVPNVVAKINDYKNIEPYEKRDITYTMDTHDSNYLSTQEGKNLPIAHCIYPSIGWALNEEVFKGLQSTCGLNFQELRKNTFGSLQLKERIERVYGWDDRIDSIELIGVCTGICVISNAIILKNQFPEVPIIVDASCCACVTPESHSTALSAMKMCQIEIINE